VVRPYPPVFGRDLIILLGVPARANSSDHPGVRTTLYVLLVSDLLIVLRTLFRLAESAEGTFSSTMTNQVSADFNSCMVQARGSLCEPTYGAYRCREPQRMIRYGSPP